MSFLVSNLSVIGAQHKWPCCNVLMYVIIGSNCIIVNIYIIISQIKYTKRHEFMRPALNNSHYTVFWVKYKCWTAAYTLRPKKWVLQREKSIFSIVEDSNWQALHPPFHSQHSFVNCSYWNLHSSIYFITCIYGFSHLWYTTPLFMGCLIHISGLWYEISCSIAKWGVLCRS